MITVNSVTIKRTVIIIKIDLFFAFTSVFDLLTRLCKKDSFARNCLFLFGCYGLEAVLRAEY